MLASMIRTKHIADVPFAEIMARAGTKPALLDFLMPGMDLLIWRMRPCVREPVTMELRQSALRVLDHAIEGNNAEPGAAIYEFDGFSFFAFASAHRERVLAEMGIRELMPF